jgi:hypothetical protein
MRAKDIIRSWDFLLAFIICIIAIVTLASFVGNELSKDLYGVGISVLSIVFSVYFAALAIIISSGDDDFIYFLEEVGDYSRIIKTFRFSLIALFIALLYSIVMYTVTSVWINDKILTQPKWFLVGFSFLFLYSLFVAFGTVVDAINYAKARADFLKKIRQK